MESLFSDTDEIHEAKHSEVEKHHNKELVVSGSGDPIPNDENDKDNSENCLVKSK